MPFSNKRNSRDDKSGKSKQPSTAKSFDKKNQKFDKKEGTTFGQKRRDNNVDQDKPYSKSANKSWNGRGNETSDAKDNRYQAKEGGKAFGQKSRNNQDGDKPFDRSKKVWEDRDNKKPDFRNSKYPVKDENKSFGQKRRNNEEREQPFDRPKRAWNDKENKSSDFKPNKYPSKDDSKSFGQKGRSNEERSFDRPKRVWNDKENKPSDFKSNKYQSKDGAASFDRKRRNDGDRPVTKSWKDRDGEKRGSDDRFKTNTQRFSKEREEDGLVRLNRYIANSGICSRRKADELIQAGVVMVNGVVVTELGVKVDAAKDEIRYNGEKLKREKMVYVLLNKPKDYITTTDDPQERRTVMHLVEKASKERIYPVGRLDRNTTGLLLLTNDGNLAEKLSHPRNSIMKIYQIELNKNLTQGDLNKISYGLELEDGFIKPDEVTYVQGASKREIGIQIHSGKNRIVRRIFESLGYDVVKLDRVIYANLTKKDLPRGRWRYLEEKEIIQLKHFIK